MLGRSTAGLLHSQRDDVVLELRIEGVPGHQQVAKWIDSGIGDLVATVKARLEHQLARGT